MADYTVQNLKQVEDVAPRFGMPAEMQSRFARRALGLESSGLGHFTLAPGFRVPFGHRHETQEEVYVVVAGSLRMKVEDEIVELGQWDAIRIPAGTMRQPEAGPEGAEMIVFGAPAGAEQDAELVPGWWSD